MFMLNIVFCFIVFFIQMKLEFKLLLSVVFIFLELLIFKRFYSKTSIKYDLCFIGLFSTSLLLNYALEFRTIIITNELIISTSGYIGLLFSFVYDKYFIGKFFY